MIIGDQVQSRAPHESTKDGRHHGGQPACEGGQAMQVDVHVGYGGAAFPTDTSRHSLNCNK